MLTLNYWITALVLACLAVCWADVLVRPGMLLAPVQAWVRKLHKALFKRGFEVFTSAEDQLVEGWYYQCCDLDDRWCWKPLWGCWKCVAGQMGFWGYLWFFRAEPYSLLAHLGFAAVTLVLSFIVRAWTTE